VKERKEKREKEGWRKGERQRMDRQIMKEG
jgi:hypothetical protein